MGIKEYTYRDKGEMIFKKDFLENSGQNGVCKEVVGTDLRFHC